jgi:hypothetical protein
MAIASCAFHAVLSGDYLACWWLYVTLISSMNKLLSATANHIITYFEMHGTPFMNLAFVLRLVATQQGTVQPNN